MPDDNAAVIEAAEKILNQEAPPAAEPAENQDQPETVEGETAKPEAETEETQPEPEKYVPVAEFNRTAYQLRKMQEKVTRLERGGNDYRPVPPVQPAEFVKPEPTLDSCGGDLELLVKSHEGWTLEKRDFDVARGQHFAAVQRSIQDRHQHGQDKLGEAVEKFPDFVSALDAVGLRENKPEMIGIVDALLENDHFAEVGYYLAKNPNELKRLSVFEGRKLDQEVGKLELKIMAEQALKTNKQKPLATKVEAAGAGQKPSAERDPRKDFERAREHGSKDPRYWAEYILNHKGPIKG